MKIFTQVNRSQGMIRTLVGLKSRITSTKPLLTMVILLVLGGWSSEAWGREGVAYAWPNTSSTTKNSLNDGTIPCGVYVSMESTTPPNYYQYDNASQTILGTRYFYAKAGDGYYFIGWYSDSKYQNLVNRNSSYSDGEGTGTHTRYAKFGAVTVTSVKTNAGVSAPHHSNTVEGTVVFNVEHADAVADFLTPTVTKTSGDGTFAYKSVSYSANTVTVTYTYSAGGCLDHTDYAKVKLTSKGYNTGKNTGTRSSVEATVTAEAGSKYAQTVTWTEDAKTKVNLQMGVDLCVEGFAVASTDQGQNITYSSETTSNVTVITKTDGKQYLHPVSKGSSNIYATQAADCKYAAKTSDALMFTVSNRQTPTMVLKDSLANDVTATVLVNESVQINLDHVSSDNNFYITQDDNGNHVQCSRSGNVVTITGLREGTANVTLHQNQTSDIFQASKTFAITVQKHTTTISILAPATMKVGEECNTPYTTTNNSATVNFTTDKDGVVEMVNGKLRAIGEGTVKITYSQTGDDVWTGDSKEKEIQVSKKNPNLLWKVGSAYTTNCNPITTIYTTENQSADCPVTVTSNTPSIARYIDGKIYVYGTAGTASFTVSQPGNTMYNAFAATTYTFTVSKPNNHVELNITSSNYNQSGVCVANTSTMGWSNGLHFSASGGWDDKYAIYEITGVPYTISFGYQAGTAATGIEWYVSACTTKNGSYDELWTSSSSSGSKTIENSKLKGKNYKFFKFCYSGNIGGTFTNVKITEHKEIVASNKTFDGTYHVGDAATTENLMIQWYNQAPITVTSNNPKFTFNGESSYVINSSLDSWAQNVNVPITYSHTEAGTNDQATITFTAQDGFSKTITVTGSTLKKAQTLSWEDDYLADEPVLPINRVAAVAKASSDLTPVYTITNESEAGVFKLMNEGTQIKAIKPGTATITASQNGNDSWASAESISKTFRVSEKQVVQIKWAQNFMRLKTNSSDTTLLAQVFIQDSEGNLTYSADLTNAIHYSSNSSSVVSITNKVLSVVDKGTTTIVATFDDQDLYAGTSVTIPVKVREPSAGCDDPLVVNEPDQVEFFQGNLNEIDKEAIEIDRTIGEPDKLTFHHNGAKWTLFFDGTIKVQQKLKGSNNFVDVANGEVTPEVNHWQETNPIQLDRNATHIRFVRPYGGQGYHYIKNVEVTLKQYIESTTASIAKGQIKKGSEEYQDIVVNYSNVKDAPTVTTDNTSITTNIAVIDADCGDAGSQTIRVYLNTETEGEIDGKIIIADPLSTARLEIPVSATVVKSTQEITWAPTTDILTTGTVNFNAISTSNLEVSYELTAGSDVATLEAGVLTILKEGDFTITAKQDGNEYYYAAQVVPVEFHVTRAIPAITVVPVAEDITLPAKLKDVILSNAGSAAVVGSFAWTDENTKVVDGTNNYSMTFHPTNSAIYDDAVFNVSIKATRGTQSIVWDFEDNQKFPCSAPITFDAQATSGLKVTYTSSDESIAKVSAAGELLVQNGGTVTIYADQEGGDDYLPAAQVSRTLTLEKRTPSITTIPTAADIYVTNPLLESGLTDGVATIDNVAISGSWSWQNTGYYPPAGKNSYTVVFTPANTILYETTTCLVEVNVKKFKQEISWGFANNQSVYVTADINFTGSNAASATSEEEVRYTTSSPEIAYVNNQNHLVILGAGEIDIIATPDENDHYESTSLTHHLTINRLLTTVMANPAAAEDLTYGQALNATAVVGGTVKGSDDAVLEGTWAWNNGAETLNAGNDQVRGVTFTPNDSHWYATATSTATVNVNKATPEEMANNVAVTYGTAASSVTLSGSGNGTWSWNDSRANETLDAGSYSLDVRFTPNDGDNYNVQNTTVQVTVNPATPDLAWTKAPTECLTTDANVSFAAASEASSGAISYEIVSGTGVSIDATSGVLTITEAGTATIQATIAATQNYESRSITTSLTITPPNVFTNATGNGKWDDPANWSVKVPQEEAPDVVVSGELVIDGEVTVGDLTIQPAGGVTIVDGGKLTVTGHSNDIPEYGDIHVKDDGALELESTAVLEVRNFTLDAKLGDVSDDTKKGASGQVDGTEQLSINGEVYFDLQLDPGARATYGWYTFTVPFEVNVVGDIYRLNNDGSMTLYKAGKDFIVMRYDEAKRARGEKGWVKLNSGVLHAGIGYNITVDDEVEQNVLRFVWNKNNTFGASYSCPLQLSESTTDKAGWNGLGNGTLTHTQLNDLDDEVKVQMYDHESNTFIGVYANEFTYAVGTAFFYQAENTDPLVLTQADGSRVLRAPQREGQRVGEFQLSLTEDGVVKKSDLMYVSADESATGEYRVGRDLLKMTNPTEANVAQMWSERNGLKLCDIEVQLMGSSATCELGLYAPKAGSYTLDVERAPENTMLYLTYNGRAIWNLTYSPYVFDLTKGTTEGYGLKMYVMQVATDLEESGFSDQNSVRKVLIDDVIYIVTPEGKMYDITGKSANY